MFGFCTREPDSPGLTLFIKQEGHDWSLLNNYNMTIVHYISPMLSPHPADPTLTTDNLMEVVKEVEDRWWDLGRELGVLYFKSEEIKSLYQSVHHRMEAVVDYYVRHHPTLSWKEVAGALRGMHLDDQADKITAKYIKGTDVTDVNHVTCLILNQAVDGQLLVLDFKITLIQAILITTVKMLRINDPGI